MSNLREVEFIEKESPQRAVDIDTIVVGLSAHTLSNARNTLVGELHRHQIGEFELDTGYSNAIYLIDGIVVQLAFTTENHTPPYSLRFITEKEESGTLEKHRGLANKLGLPMPEELSQVKRYYEME